jgi:nicotinamidase-related amidase
MKVIVVVDMQNDFVSWQDKEVGKKLVEDTRKYLLSELTNGKPDTHIIFTMDTHNEEHYDKYFESKTYPIHCIHGSKGWNIVDELSDIALDPVFTVFNLTQTLKLLGGHWLIVIISLHF